MNVTCKSSLPLNEEMWLRNQWIQPISVFYYVLHLASTYYTVNHLEPVHLFELNTLLYYTILILFYSLVLFYPILVKKKLKNAGL